MMKVRVFPHNESVPLKYLWAIGVPSPTGMILWRMMLLFLVSEAFSDLFSISKYLLGFV